MAFLKIQETLINLDLVENIRFYNSGDEFIFCFASSDDLHFSADILGQGKEKFFERVLETCLGYPKKIICLDDIRRDEEKLGVVYD